MTLNDPTLRTSAVMTQTSLPQRVALPEAPDPNLPVEPTPLALEEIPESAPVTDAVLPAILEAADDRYYAQHWGINE